MFTADRIAPCGPGKNRPGFRMIKRTLLIALAALLAVSLPVCAEERVVLTIGDSTTRSGNLYDAEMGMWQYVAEQAGVEIRYIYMTPEEYASAMSSGSLPDIVATQNNLATIQENGVALNACSDGSPEAILSGVRGAVDAFVGDAEQFDDLTMLCLEYKGPAKK